MLMNTLLKKTIASATLTWILISSSAVFADTASTSDIPTTPSVTVIAPQQESVPVSITASKNIDKIKAKWAALITERITALGKHKTKITDSKVLTDDQKNTLTTMIDKNVTDLTTLNTTLSGETDISKAKVDVKSIYSTFRIYAVFIPKISHLVALYTQQSHIITLLSTTIPKLQTKLDTWKAKGVDTTSYQKTLDDAKTNFTTIQGQIVDLITKTNAIQISDYPTVSKTTFAEIKTGMKWIASQISIIKKSINWKNPKTSKKSTK